MAIGKDLGETTNALIKALEEVILKVLKAMVVKVPEVTIIKVLEETPVTVLKAVVVKVPEVAIIKVLKEAPVKVLEAIAKVEQVDNQQEVAVKAVVAANIKINYSDMYISFFAVISSFKCTKNFLVNKS
jgi:hypothetical protein